MPGACCGSNPSLYDLHAVVLRSSSLSFARSLDTWPNRVVRATHLLQDFSFGLFTFCYWLIIGLHILHTLQTLHLLARTKNGVSGGQLPLLFTPISIRFQWRREGAPAKWGAPDPGPRSSGDQGTYLACFPARNIQPSDSPSTWARPAPTR